MPNWWETEQSNAPGQSAWQRMVSRYRQQLGLGASSAQPTAAPRQWRFPPQGTQPAPPPTPTPAPTPTPEPYPIHLPTITRTGPTGRQGRTGTYYGPAPSERATPEPLPPSVDEDIWGWDVGQTYEERGRELATKLFPWMSRPIPTDWPGWSQKLERFFRMGAERSLGRLARAWEHPEKRALMGGPVEGLGTAEELEAGAEPEEVPEGKLALGQFFQRAWEHFGKSQETALGAELFTPEGRETYQRLAEARKTGTPEEVETAQEAVRQFSAEHRPVEHYPAAGGIWEDLTRMWKAPRYVEQAAAVGAVIFQEGALFMEQTGTALDILRRPESKDISAEQFYPLTTRGWSFFIEQTKHDLDEDLQMTKDLFAGRVTVADWREAITSRTGEEHILAKALLDIADGTATAQEIALAHENLGAELFGQIVCDPANIDFLLRVPQAKRMAHLAKAQARMLESVADKPKVLAALDTLSRSIEAGGLKNLRVAEQELIKAGQMPSPTLMEKVRDFAKIPFELTPEARALRDLGEITIAAGPVVGMVDNADDAIRLLSLWAEDPAVLRSLLGRIPESVAGQKTSIVLRGILDNLAQSPAATARVWDAKKFWTTLDELAHDALRLAYGYTPPNRIQRFFGTYKRLMSEFYLTATYSPGYVTRNMFGDMSAMALDGLLTFESRPVIDAYLAEFGEISTRRLMTEGRAGREALAGEGAIKSMLPGVFGRWSELGQEITRFAEPFGRLPLGEESRYRRALYKGLKRFFEQNALEFVPDLPELVLVRYGDRAEDLRQLVGLETSLERRRQIVTDFLGGEKGKQLSPFRYVDEVDLDAMSPEVSRQLLDEFGKLTAESTTDDVEGVIGRMREMVDEEEARRLGEMADLPARSHIQTDVGEAEIADGLIDDLEDVVARTGDRKLASEVEELKRQIPETERQLDTARGEAFQSLIDESTPDGLEVLMRANSDVEEMRKEWRGLCDTLRRDAKAAYDANPRNAAAIWSDYFRAARKGWEDLANQRIARYRDAAEQLGRLRRGETFEEVVGTSRRARAEEWLRKASQMPEPERPVGYLPGKVLRDDQGEKFERFLAWNRSKEDAARTQAWRAVYGTEPEDYGKVLDILDSADRDVEQFGKATSGRVRELYREAEAHARKMLRRHKSEKMQSLAVKMVWEKYWGLRNDTWRRYWDAAQQRWQIAERDILMGNYSRAQRMEALPGPRVEELPVIERPVALSVEDAEAVKRAALKPEAEWTAEEKEAVKRWTGSGRAVPRSGPSLHQPGQSTYTRNQFRKDLAEAANLTGEQSEKIGRVLDALADTWSKRTGLSPEDWYGRHFAGLFRGNPPPGALFQGSTQAPRWWYKAEEVVAAKMPNRASIDQIRSILTKGGIKKDELRWNGVLKWLDNQEGMLAKDDVLSYLQSHRIELEEFVSGADPKTLVNLEREVVRTRGEYDTALDRLADRLSQEGWGPKQTRRTLSRLDEASVQEELRAISPEVGADLDRVTDTRNTWDSTVQARQAERANVVTKYENYVEPGAVPGSYREIRLALPWEQLAEPISFDEWCDVTKMPESVRGRRSARQAYEADLKDPTSAAYGPGGVLHKEPHWAEPNVILHARVNERVGPNGERVLHLEELQSQWQQEARRAGTRPSRWPDNWSVREPTKEERYHWVVNPNTRADHLLINNRMQTPTDYMIRRPRPGAPRDQFDLWWQDRHVASYDTLEEARQAAWDSVTVPDGLLAAFDDKGQALHFGFNELDVKTGVLQKMPPEAPFAGTWDELGLKRMMRWAAENDYDAITWTTGAMQVDRYPTAARKVFDRLEWTRYDDGTIVVRGSRKGKQVLETQFGPTGKGLFLGKEVTLEEAVGKNIAAQIFNSPTYTPGIFEGRDFVVGERALADLYDRIFPYSANKLLKRWGGQVEDLGLTAGKAQLAEGWRVGRDSPGTWGLFNEIDELVEGGFEAIADIQAAAARHASAAAEMNVPGFRITPQMKSDLLNEGLPLFQRLPERAKGATDFLEDGRAVIRFFEEADFSTAIHEIGHVLLPTLPEEDLRLVETWLGMQEGEFFGMHEIFVEATSLQRKAGKLGKEVAYSPEMKATLARYEKAQEQWARGFERYLAEGVAPTPELADVFERMKQWLLDIYHKIRGSSIDIDLSDEVRGVMDRLLAESPRPRASNAGEVGIFQRSEPVGSPAFRRWFGDSVTVNETGRPITLYHGAYRKFDEPRPGPGGLIWLTDRSGYVRGTGDELAEVYAKLENPIDLTVLGAEGMTKAQFDEAMTEALAQYNIRYGVDVPECWDTDFDDLEVFSWLVDNGAELRAAAQARGYDGIVLAERYRLGAGAARQPPSNSYVVFDPGQVKGVGNTGSWSAETADLLMQAERRAADLPGLGADELAGKALTEMKENGGYTLAIDGGSPAGGYAVAIYPDAERIIPLADLTEEDIVQYINDWSDVLGTDARAHLGGWVSEDQAYLDLSAVLSDADEAMVLGYKNRQQALFDLNTFEDIPVTRGAAEEAAQRLGISLERETTPALKQAEQAEQLGFWNIDPQGWQKYGAAVNQPGATAGPLPHDILQNSTQATHRALNKIEQGVIRDWNQWQGLAADQEAGAAVMRWFDDQVTPSYFEQRAMAYDYATSEADFALLDYGRRRNLDMWMNYVVPYHYWFTRAGTNWAKRIASRPGILANYFRVRDAMELANQNAGRRQRFQHMFRVPFPWLPQWMGDSVYVDPMALAAPFSQIFYNDWGDQDESKRGLTKVYETARGFGLRPYHFWEYLYQTGAFAKAGELVGMAPEAAQEMLGPEYQDNFPNVLPQTNLIRALTALAREKGVEAIPPGGINIEAPFRRLIGLPAGEIWDPYRINRMLANLAAEQATNTDLALSTLRAQELVARDEDQTGKVWDASSQLAQEVAQELNWTPEQLEEAQRILAKAMQRTTFERGIGTIGWLTGPRMAVEPTGERAQLEMAEQARATTWSPDRPGGSREAYNRFKRQYPAMYPRATQYEVMPGEKEYEAMPPGARANWLVLKHQKEMLHADYDEAVDDLLRAEPWNWTARGELEDQRRAALAQLELQYPMPEMTGEIPAILYGMNPEEMWNSSVESELYKMQATKPSPSEFETEEGVDWDAYYTAETKWRANLPRVFGFGIPRGGAYVRMDPKAAMEQFEQRYDSPLEAAYQVYQQEVAEPAWKNYNQLKAAEERQWPGVRDLQDQYFELDVEGRRALLRAHPELGDYWDWKDQQGGSAYERTIGQVAAVPAAALVPAILEQYAIRGWTEEQLKRELEGVTFPSLAQQQDLKRGARAQQGTAGAAQAAAAGGYGGGYGGGGGYGWPAGYPYRRYSPGELNYLKNAILRKWNARQGRYSGSRYGGGSRYASRYYGAGEEPDYWQMRRTQPGGPWENTPGPEIWGGPFRG